MIGNKECIGYGPITNDDIFQKGGKLFTFANRVGEMPRGLFKYQTLIAVQWIVFNRHGDTLPHTCEYGV